MCHQTQLWFTTKTLRLQQQSQSNATAQDHLLHQLHTINDWQVLKNLSSLLKEANNKTPNKTRAPHSKTMPFNKLRAPTEKLRFSQQKLVQCPAQDTVSHQFCHQSFNNVSNFLQRRQLDKQLSNINPWPSCIERSELMLHVDWSAELTSVECTGHTMYTSLMPPAVVALSKAAATDAATVRSLAWVGLVNRAPHSLQLYGLSPVWIRLWTVRVWFCAKQRPQTLQLYGRSPVWLRLCTVRLLFWRNRTPQTLQANGFLSCVDATVFCKVAALTEPSSTLGAVNGFSPVWTRSCLIKKLL